MEQHLRVWSGKMNPNFAISVLTVKGQFVIGNSHGENALIALAKFLHRAGIDVDDFIEIQIAERFEDGRLSSRMLSLSYTGKSKTFPTIEEIFDK